MKLSFWWKDLITKLLLLYAGFRIGYGVYSVFQAYFSLNHPLLPYNLPHYVSFQYLFLIPVWIIVLVLCFRLIKSEVLMRKWFYALFIGVVVYQLIMEIVLIRLIVRINPFG